MIALLAPVAGVMESDDVDNDAAEHVAAHTAHTPMFELIDDRCHLAPAEICTFHAEHASMRNCLCTLGSGNWSWLLYRLPAKLATAAVL